MNNSITCNQSVARHEFIATMKGLQRDFESVRSNVKAREEALTRALDKLTNSLNSTVDSAISDRLAKDNPLVMAARSTDEKIATRLSLWRKKVEEYDRNTDFRKYFGDSLLVYVYGKVKAGKSSLGNHVAYGHGDPDSRIINAAIEDGIQPTFFMADSADSKDILEKESELRTRGKFAVGAKETTAEIQGYRFPGLTWIDSPGLGSVTEQNGELSKSYADAADLILYPMNSGQPGRATDLNEISSLLHARKSFLAVITRCDTNETDEDEDGNIVSKRVMKSPKDRQDQINYVQKEISAIANKKNLELLDADVIAISTRYAEDHADEPLALRESGMPSLFEKLSALTKAQGVAMKKAVPLNNLRAFVDIVLHGALSVKTLHTELKFLGESLALQRKSLQAKQTAVTGRVMLDLDLAIEQEVHKHRFDHDTADLSRACSKIVQNTVVRHTTVALTEVLKDAQTSIDTAVKFDEFKDLPKFKDITQDFNLSNETKGRAAGGAVGAVALGIAAAILTGGQSLWYSIPAGIAAATAGSWAGSKAGESMASDTTITVKVGDNTREVVAETMRITCDIASAAVAKTFQKLDQDFLKPVEARIKDIVAALDYFETTLLVEVRPNEV